MGKNTSVDEYIDGAAAWQDGLRRPRQVLLASGREETVKWGAPCYTTRDGKNVVGIGADHFPVLDVGGVFLVSRRELPTSRAVMILNLMI